MIKKTEKEGYSYRGFALGEKVLYDGEETIVIGFDEEADGSDGIYTAVKVYGEGRRESSEYMTTILKGEEKSNFRWTYYTSLQKVEPPKPNTNIPKFIGMKLKCIGNPWEEAFAVGKTYMVNENGKIVADDGFGWYSPFHESTTVQDVIDYLANGEIAICEFVESSKPTTQPKPNTKIKKENTMPKSNLEGNVKVKVLPQNKYPTKPIIEDDDDSITIYIGNATIYYNKEWDAIGVARTNPSDNYDPYVGRCIAVYRALYGEKGGK